MLPRDGTGHPPAGTVSAGGTLEWGPAAENSLARRACRDRSLFLFFGLTRFSYRSPGLTLLTYPHVERKERKKEKRRKENLRGTFYLNISLSWEDRTAYSHNVAANT